MDFLAVLDAAFSPSSPADGDSDADADANANASKPDIARVASARKLFATLAEEDGTRERAPLLALLDVEKRAAQCGLAEDFSAYSPGFRPLCCRKLTLTEGADNGLLGLLKLYLSRFGDKACCFDDLKPYVQLDGEQLTQWVAHLDSLGHDTVCNFAALQFSHCVFYFGFTELAVISPTHDKRTQNPAVPSYIRGADGAARADTCLLLSARISRCTGAGERPSRN